MRVFIKSSLLFSILAAAAGCSGGPAANTPSNNSTSQPAVAASSPGIGSATAQNTPGATKSTPAPANTAEAGTPASLATPSEAYKTAYAIRQKKDVQALKQVMSREMTAYFTEMGKTQKKSLDQVLALLVEQPQAPTAETRNERISDDRAVLEFKDASGKWLPMDFVKEDGGWKMALSKVAAPKKGQSPAPKR